MERLEPIASWVCAPQLVEFGDVPRPEFSGCTLRQVLQPSLGGEVPRITISNRFGTQPLVVEQARLALSDGGHRIEPGSDCALEFHGEQRVVIAPGSEVTSDSASLRIDALKNLCVSLFFGDVPSLVTGHPGSRTTSFLQRGNCVTDVRLTETTSVDQWYWVNALEVSQEAARGAIAVLGDSLTDGRGSTTNENNRWPNWLGRRLLEHPATQGISVLNQGIGGNRVLWGGCGPTALERYRRDVLTPSGVRWVIVFEGINDLIEGVPDDGPGPRISAVDLTAAYETMIGWARARGVSVFGGTLTPFEGAASFCSRSESARCEVNAWIRSSGHFDGVIDFDATVRDPARPSRLRARFDSGDGIHLSPAGYAALAEAVDLSWFSSVSAP